MTRMHVRARSVLFCALLLAACTTLPNVQPFADATAQVDEGLNQAGTIAVARVANGEEVKPPEEGEEPSDAWQLQQAWEVRLFAAGALSAYANSLAEIVAAGNQAADASTRLGNTISEIAQQIPGVAAPSQAVVSLGQKLVEIAIKVKAAGSIAEAVRAADPAVAGIAEILVEDLGDILDLYKVGYRKTVRARYASDNEYKRLRDHRNSVQAYVEGLRKSTDLTDDAAKAKLMQAEELLVRTNEAFAPSWEKRQALEKERKDFEELIGRTRRAVTAWRKTHADLHKAIRESRQPSWRSFLAQAQELYALVEAIREEHEKADAPSMDE